MGYQVRSPKDKEEIKKVFKMLKQCFPKIKRSYFAKRILQDPDYQRANTRLLIKDNSLVSHVQLFKKKIYFYGKRLPIVGLGAICTLPAYRNRGYCQKLLEKTIQDIESQTPVFIILFTRILEFYEKLKFSKIVRKFYLLKKKSEDIFCQRNGIKVRRFNPRKDLKAVIKIYHHFYHSYFGPVVRKIEDWQAQLSYFNEDKRLFLVSEKKGKLKAYIRCKRPKQGLIDVVEFATDDKENNFLPYLLQYVLKFTDADYLRIDSRLVRGELSAFFTIKKEDNTLLMYRPIGKRCRINKLKMEEITFLESDTF